MSNSGKATNAMPPIPVINPRISGYVNQSEFEHNCHVLVVGEGTGLGLGISRRFIRAYGGDIEFVSSVPFSATTFRITLPIKKVDTLANNSKDEEGAA